MSRGSPERRSIGFAGSIGFARSSAIVVLLGLLAMWPVLRGDFSTWDDPATIAENPQLAPPTLAGLAARWAEPHLHIYAPLTHTVWTLVAWLTYDPHAPRPLGPVGFKVASVLAHLAASVAVLSIGRRAFGPRWAAVVAGAAFAVHPIQVEAVAWTSGLKDVLCGLFAAIAIRLYVGDAGRRPRTSAALVAMIFAMLAKPIAFALTPALFAADALWLRRPARESVARLVPFAVLSIMGAVFARALQEQSRLAEVTPLWPRPLIAGFDLAFYLWKGVAPARLAFDYGWSPRAIVASPWLWVAWLVPAIVAAIAWSLRRRLPFVGIGLAIAVWPLVPVSGLVYFDWARVSVVADHYAYLPMIGASLAVGQLARSLAAWRRGAAIGASIVVLLTWAGLSMRQATTWRTPFTIADQTLAVNPRSAGTLNHLGQLAQRRGDLAEAERYERQSIEIEPVNPLAILSLGDTLLLRGRYDEAMAQYRRAAELVPNTREPWYAMARVHELRGETLARLEMLARGAEWDASLPPERRERQMASLREAIRVERARAATRGAATTTAATRP